jgi:hypothetical protein
MARNSALSSSQMPDACEKASIRNKHGMHRVARSDHPEGRKQQHDREQIEETSLGVHESVF